MMYFDSWARLSSLRVRLECLRVRASLRSSEICFWSWALVLVRNCEVDGNGEKVGGNDRAKG